MPAADLAKQGTDLYNAGDYAGAVAPLRRAHEFEPSNFEYRFMLAQALRQSGNCGEAVPHYKALAETAPPERAEEVNAAMAACPTASITEQPATPPPPPPPPPPEPEVVVRGGIGTGNALLLIGSGAGLATGLSLFMAAQMDDGDADVAASYDDHERIATRADRLRLGAAAAAGAGVVLGVVAVLRIKRSNPSTEVAITPRKGGGMLVLGRSW